MAIASLTLWLNDSNRDYNHGRLLYEQYGTNPVTLALLKSGSGSYHFSKLQLALEELNLKSDLIPKQIKIEVPIKEPAPRPGKEIKDYKSAPQQIIDIRNEKNQRYALARKLHETIRVLDSQEHRLAAALELLDHMDYVNECWNSVDLFNETGEVKPPPQPKQVSPVESMTVAELLKAQKNLPPNISKDSKKLELTKTPAKKIKIAYRLEFNQKRLKEIKERLAKL